MAQGSRFSAEESRLFETPNTCQKVSINVEACIRSFDGFALSDGCRWGRPSCEGASPAATVEHDIRMGVTRRLAVNEVLLVLALDSRPGSSVAQSPPAADIAEMLTPVTANAE